MDFQFKECYNFYDLMQIVKILRSPEGCQWDMKQNHHSVRSDLIEETYEVLDAIDRDDRAALQEELGDLLLQVVFHTEMENEVDGFTMSDVTDGICKKLIERHPHVFGNVKVSGEEQILVNWDEIKKASKGQKSQTDAMMSVPRSFPSLLRASKLRSKAAKVHYDTVTEQSAIDELQGALDEIKKCTSDDKVDISQFDVCGKLLFAAVKYAHAAGIDSEHSLAVACDNFITEFKQTEKLAQLRGIDLKEADCAQVETLRAEAQSETNA